MRLKFKHEKIKIILLGFVLSSFIAFALLYLVRLDVFAASSGGGSTPSYYTEYPLPYGVGTNMGYDSSVVDISQAFNSVSNYATTQLWSGGQISGIYVYEYNTSVNRLDLFVTMVSTSDTPTPPTFAPNPQTYPSVTSGDTFSCSNINFGYIVSCFLSDYHCEWIVSGNITNLNIGTSWTTALPTSISAVVPNNFYYGYPIYIYGNPDIISAGGRIGLTYGNTGSSDIINGITGSGEGSITDGQGNVTNFNYNVDLDITPITDSLETLHEDSQQILETTEDIRNYLLAENPTASEIYTVFAGSDVFGPILAIGQSASNLIGGFSVFPDAKTKADMEGTFYFKYSTYSFTDDSWTDHYVPINFDFTWYESIRSNVLNVLFVFLSLGWLFYFFKTFPSLMQGASAVGFTGKSIAESGDKK